MRSNRALQGGLARCGRIAAIGLEIAVEAPDQCAHAALRGSLRVGECVELVHQTLGMDPAQAMLTDIELAGIVADDHGVGQQAMRLDAAPQGALGGDQHGIGIDAESRDAEPVEMGVPGRAIGEGAIGMLGQAGDDGSGERPCAHIGQRFGIDDVIAVTGAQQFEEVETALGAGGAEPGELRVADLGAEAVLGFVARTGVVDGDPGRALQAGTQHAAGFVQEALLAGDQQANDLPLGDEDAEPLQQRDQPRHRDLSLMILGEHEAAQLGSEMAIDAVRQSRHHGLAVRGLPAFPAEMGDMRADHQILHQEARIAFEARAGRRLGLERPLLVDRQLRFACCRAGGARRALPPAAARSPCPFRSV